MLGSAVADSPCFVSVELDAACSALDFAIDSTLALLSSSADAADGAARDGGGNSKPSPDVGFSITGLGNGALRFAGVLATL